jgi:hypothetical protein
MGRGQRALDRVLRIAPQGYGRAHAVSASSVALAREYLRRLAEWAELSGQLAGLGARDALRLDLAGLLLPELVLSPDLAAGLGGLKVSYGLVGQVAAHYVRWEAAAEHSALAHSGLWEPYEPLVRLFERGGELFLHHGFVHVEHCTCFTPLALAAYAPAPPLFDLSDRALGRLAQAPLEPPAPEAT